MQPWSVFVFRRSCPFSPFAQSSAALQAPGSCQESLRWREGRRENPSFLPRPHLARKLAGAAGRALWVPPSPTCLSSLAGESGGLASVMHRFLLPGGRRGVVPEGQHTRQKTVPEATSPVQADVSLISLNCFYSRSYYSDVLSHLK